MIKAIIFDFFDVIRTDAYKSWLATNNILHEGAYFDASYQQDMGAITVEQFLEKLSELTGRTVTFEEVDGAATVDKAVVEVVSKLHQNYKLGLISNAPSKIIRDILTEHDLAPFFDVIVVSSEVGIVKPDPEIFQLTLQKLGVEAAQSIFIDDNPRHVEAAGKLDIHAIQFESAQQLKDDLAKLGVAL